MGRKRRNGTATSRVSASAAAVRRLPHGSSRTTSGLFFQTRPGSYNDVTLIEFLNDLQREFRGRRVVLVWDGLPSHKSGPMQAYLRAQRAWLTVERLPGYAPDLNPAELVWGNVKGGELANLCADNLGEVEHELRAGLRRVRRSPTLPFAFLPHTGRSF